jgi:Flp pilus assembly protein protease CpaA
MIDIILKVLITCVLIYTMTWDVFFYKLPDTLTIALFILFTIQMFVNNHDIISHFQCAFFCFWIGFGFVFFNVMGLGDIKLFAAIVYGIGAGNLLHLLLWTSLFGGGLALFYLFKKNEIYNELDQSENRFQQLTKPLFNYLKDTIERPYIAEQRERLALPYGVAIGVAGLKIIWGVG